MSRSQFVRLTLQTIDLHPDTLSPMPSTFELNQEAITRRPSFGAMLQTSTTPQSDEEKAAEAFNGSSMAMGGDNEAGHQKRNPPGFGRPVAETKSRVASSASMGSFRSFRGREHELEGVLRVSIGSFFSAIVSEIFP